MTANEMMDALENELDAVASNDAPEISDEQGSIFLTSAVESLLTQIVEEGLDKTTFNASFTAGLKSSGEVTSPITTNIPISHHNGTFFQLPEDVYLIIHERAEIDKRDCKTGKLATLPVFPVDEDYINANIINKEKKPYFAGYNGGGLVWSLFHNKISDNNNKIIELISDGTFNVSKYFFRYLIQPNIKVDRENPSNQINTTIWKEFHLKIVKRAALIAIENLRQESRFQSKSLLNAQEGI